MSTVHVRLQNIFWKIKLKNQQIISVQYSYSRAASFSHACRHQSKRNFWKEHKIKRVIILSQSNEPFMRRPGDKTAGDVQWHDTLIRWYLNFKPSSSHSTGFFDYEHVGRCEQCHCFQSGFQILFFHQSQVFKEDKCCYDCHRTTLSFHPRFVQNFVAFLG